MTYSLHALSVSAGRLGLAVLLACSVVAAQAVTPSGSVSRAPVPTRQFLTPEQAEILSYQSIVYLDDGQGDTVKTLRIEGINVQVVNGEGTTNTTNGLGNLIVGYNETGNVFGDDRTGAQLAKLNDHAWQIIESRDVCWEMVRLCKGLQCFVVWIYFHFHMRIHFSTVRTSLRGS